MNSVEWGEFRLGDLFEVLSYKKRFDANKVCLTNGKGHPYIVRQSGNNGRKGFIDEDDVFLNEGNTISFGQDTATVFYQEQPYFTGDKIKILKSRKTKFGKQNALFFIAAISSAFSSFSWGTSSYSMDVINSQKILLPVTPSHEPDFAFMESFIAELETERVVELEAYLSAAGLTDTRLTAEEEQALSEVKQYKEFMLSEIFTMVNTKSITQANITFNTGETPYVTASASNNGVMSYISCPSEWTDEGNCIMIGGKTMTFTYQEKDFCSNDSHNIALYLKDSAFAREKVYLFLMAALSASLSHKYSWGNSVSMRKIKHDSFNLPVTPSGEPDFAFMETLIAAVQKSVIAGVAEYSAEKMRGYRSVVGE